jgi:valyl-tRNA synthetase
MGSDRNDPTMTDTASTPPATPIQPGLQSLSKSFEPAALEAHWGPEWEKRGYGVAGYRGTQAAKEGQPVFAIQLPPPNVTGTLHMGHAFNQTIMDSLTRYHRMLGANTVWIPGTDHAGIATQIVVERQLQDQGVSRHDLGRKAFVKRSGSGRKSRATPSPRRCAAWATAWTGAANTSRWTPSCPRP